MDRNEWNRGAQCTGLSCLKGLNALERTDDPVDKPDRWTEQISGHLQQLHRAACARGLLIRIGIGGERKPLIIPVLSFLRSITCAHTLGFPDFLRHTEHAEGRVDTHVWAQGTNRVFAGAPKPCHSLSLSSGKPCQRPRSARSAPAGSEILSPWDQRFKGHWVRVQYNCTRVDV